MLFGHDKLIQAILDDDEDEVRRLLSASGLSSRLLLCVTARILGLHLAAFSNSTKVARFLIDSGEPVDSQNGVGDTPLHVAARYNAWEVTDLLIDCGARRDLENHAGQTPHDVAMDSGSHSVAELLILGR